MRLLFLFTFLFFAVSCGKTTSEEVDGAIDIALSHLTEKRCDKALEVLNKVNGHSDAVYLQVLASAYACKANYNEISFVINDLAEITAADPADLLKSVSIMSTSVETTTDSVTAINLTRASQVALAGKSQLERNSTFGERKSGDLSVQALLLNIAALGKHLNHFGNVNATGVKGGGVQGNKCFLNYTDPRATALVGAVTGACVSTSNGHADLDLVSTDGKRRVCEGLIYLTNSLDILANLDLTNFEEFDVIIDITAQLDTFKQAAHSQGLGYLIDELSQTSCVQTLQSASGRSDIEYLYALIFETSLQ